MRRVYVIVEGPTEEQFVAGPLAEFLWPRDVLLTPIILGVPGHKGGRVSYARVRKDVVRQLKQDREAYCSMMVDYYGLQGAFPGMGLAELGSLTRVERIERSVQEDIVASFPDLRADVRLIPYLSLHEFEGLLFSDPAALADAVGQPHLRTTLSTIRNRYGSPEDIDDGVETAPSKRILALHPGYRKVIDGQKAATRIGIERMRRECVHFRAWIEKLELLPNLG